MLRRIFFVFTIAAFFQMGESHAATYYIDSAAGNNSNSGTSTDSAWQTIAKVTSQTFAAGDTILFKRGQTFIGNLSFTNETGTNENRITVGAYGTGENPILNANGSGRTLDIRNGASYMTFENLTLRGAATDSVFLFNGVFTGLIFQNLDIASSTGFFVNSTNSTTTDMLLQNISMHHVTTGFSNLGYSLNDTYRNITISGASFGLGSSGSATSTGLTIDGLVISNVVGSGVAIRRLANSTISNVTISSTTLRSLFIDLGLSNVNFSNITVSSSTQDGIYLNILGPVTIAHATTTGNGLQGINILGTGSLVASGIYSSRNIGSGMGWTGGNTGSRATISNSTFEYNGTTLNLSNGLTLSGAGNATTTNTIARFNSNDGFNINNTLNAVFDQTWSEGNGVDGSASDGDGYSWHATSSGSLTRSFIKNNKKGGVTNVGESNVDVYNNIFVHETTGTLGSLAFIDNAISKLYNNTLYNPSGQGIGIQFGNTASSTVYNNILVGFQTGMYKGASNTLYEDHNIVHGAASSSFSGFVGSLTSTTSNPLLVNPASSNFALTSNSFAINNGRTSGCPLLDYNGSVRNGSCDIGAIEYAVVAPTASFTSSVNGLSVSFSDTSSDSDGSIASWNWNFGDSTSSSLQNPSHTYAAAGTYSVTLTATDNHGANASTSATIIVSQQAIPSTTISSGGGGFLYSQPTNPQEPASLPGTPLPTGSDKPVPSNSVAFTRSLFKGMEGEDIRMLQLVLAAFPSLYPEGLITGYYGSLTEMAVKRFQTYYGIVSSGTPETTGYGVVGPATRKKLNETELVSSLPTVPATSPVSITNTFTRDLRIGDEGADVMSLQRILNGDNFIVARSGSGSPGNETTYFGTATRDALMRFQKYYGIEPTGYFGPLTRQKAENVSAN